MFLQPRAKTTIEIRTHKTSTQLESRRRWIPIDRMGVCIWYKSQKIDSSSFTTLEATRTCKLSVLSLFVMDWLLFTPHPYRFYPSDYSTFPGTPSTFGASQSMSRSHDYFEDHQIYQQRPKKFTDTSYLYPPAQYGGPLRTRSMGNIPTKASSFRANPPMHLGSYGETGYSNQIAASYDQSLSTFGEDLHGFSPLRTSSKGSVLSQGNWPNAAAPTLGPYPAPTLGPVPTPPSSATAPKTKDQKKSPAPIDGYVYQVRLDLSWNIRL